MKKFTFVLIAIVLAFSLLVGCNNHQDENSSSSISSSYVVGTESSSSVSQNGLQSTSSVQQNSSSNKPNYSYSFSYSPSTSSVYVPQDPNQEAISSYPTLYAMYQMVELDDSYTGTDKTIGFSSKVNRTSSTFETYPEGYGEGTTGGRGATQENIYECATGQELLTTIETIRSKLSIDPSTKSIIKITATITEANTGATQIVFNNTHNLLLIGANSNAIFDGVGVNFKASDNVIVQNLTIHHPSRSLLNEKDCLEFNNCNYVWVDHCEFYNDYPSSSSEKDYYDGLIDVKNESSHVTISYNYLHDAWKTSLVGSGSSDIYAGRTITYHHNIFENCNSRVPAVRSGRAHIYNNYYKNILSSSANSRIECLMYVENNIFENAKKPIISAEDSILGFYNAENNVYTNSTPNQDPTDTCSFTPSYRYTVDSTSILKNYLNSTVGPNKVDVAVAMANPISYDQYVIDANLIIDRGISEIGSISLNNATAQKLTFHAKEILFATNETIAKLQNLSTLEGYIDTYFSLYASDIDSKISSINTSGAFDENATLCYNLSNLIDSLPLLVTNKVTMKATLGDKKAYFDNNFTTLFNTQVDTLNNPTSSDYDKIVRLLNLYETANDKSSLKYQELQQAYVKSTDLIASEGFEDLVDALPSAQDTTLADKDSITAANNAFNALTDNQKALVNSTKMQKFNAVLEKFNSLSNSSIKMDLSNVSTGRKTEITQIGGIKVGVSTDINNVSASFGGINYSKAVYLSGYGNKGSKCLMFEVYSNSTITIVLNSVNGPAAFKLYKILSIDSATNSVESEVSYFYTTDANIQTITLENVTAGEYRIFTDIPSGSYTASQAYIYEFSITPN